MNAAMVNMMALNGAIFMTIRNLVFGPRKGDNVQYVNYGYSKNRQIQKKRPVLIIHSPAAFVKNNYLNNWSELDIFFFKQSIRKTIKLENFILGGGVGGRGVG